MNLKDIFGLYFVAQLVIAACTPIPEMLEPIVDDTDYGSDDLESSDLGTTDTGPGNTETTQTDDTQIITDDTRTQTANTDDSESEIGGAGGSDTPDFDTGCEDGWAGDYCDVTIDCTSRRDMVPCRLEGHPGERTVCLFEACKKLGCGDATCLATGPSFPLSDTRMFDCFDNEKKIDCLLESLGECGEENAFCGQDADYGSDAASSPSSPRWVLEKEEGDEPVVQDLETGLSWQGCPAGATGALCETELEKRWYWKDAVQYCDDLAWGGYEDWYMPDAYELFSILDFGNSSYIGLLFFPHTGQSFFWTSNWVEPCLGEEDSCDVAWGFYFSMGIFAPIPSAQVLGVYTKQAQVRCARRHGKDIAAWTRAHADGERFTRRAQATNFYVKDELADLVWQGCPAGAEGERCTIEAAELMEWDEALAYCQSLTWDKMEGWRLPNIKELHSAMMFDAFENPALDPTWFPSTIDPENTLWTSTTVNYANYETIKTDAFVASQGGTFYPQSKRVPAHVMCVRDF